MKIQRCLIYHYLHTQRFLYLKRVGKTSMGLFPLQIATLLLLFVFFKYVTYFQLLHIYFRPYFLNRSCPPKGCLEEILSDKTAHGTFDFKLYYKLLLIKPKEKLYLSFRKKKRIFQIFMPSFQNLFLQFSLVCCVAKDFTFKRNYKIKRLSAASAEILITLVETSIKSSQRSAIDL